MVKIQTESENKPHLRKVSESAALAALSIALSL